jgi:protein-S-isoprenylcysteine O-methyltransferase Ste14
LLPGVLLIVARPVITIGAILIILAVITLARQSGSTGVPGDPTKQLVTIGLYRWVRNPIYLGDGILILGLSFLTRSPNLFIPCIIYLIVIDFYIRAVEEPAIEIRSGKEYIQYKKQVPRWFPKIQESVNAK